MTIILPVMHLSWDDFRFDVPVIRAAVPLFLLSRYASQYVKVYKLSALLMSNMLLFGAGGISRRRCR